MKYKTTELNEKFRVEELNVYSNAVKKFECEKEKLEAARLRYAEVVHNQCWRNWIYTDYKNHIKKLMWKNKLKELNIKSYDSNKVFEYIKNADSEFYNLFSISKEVVEYINPKSLDDLSIILAIGNVACKGDYVFELYKSKEIILFNEEIKKILSKTFKNKQEVNFIYKTLYNIRYSVDSYKVLRCILKDKDFSIVNFIKENYIFEYQNYLKIAYTSFVNTYESPNSDKIFNNLLLGVIVSCNKNKTLNYAKSLYKTAFLIKN